MKSFLILLIGVLVLSCKEPAPHFKRIVAFGDSFTDDGSSDGQGFNRISNGKVWVEYLADMLHADLDDRAWGGAKTDSTHVSGMPWSGFLWQVEQYEADEDPGHTLYTVWIGVNDFWDGKGDVTLSVENIRKGLIKLMAKKAGAIVIMNAFDPALAPAYATDSTTRAMIPAVQKQSGEFNRQLHAMLFDDQTGLSKQYPELRLYFIDIDAFMKEQAKAYKITDKQWLGTREFPSQDGYLWFDDFHPMTSCHRRIGELVYERVKR